MDQQDDDYSGDFMVLRPDKGGMLDLFYLLFSSDLTKNNAVDCPIGTEIDKVGRRWAIFISLLLQKILLKLKKPMALVGSALEQWMNLLYENGSYWNLFSNIVKGA